MRSRKHKKKLFTFEAGKTALIIVDMQNDFVRRGGLIYVKDGVRIIPNIRRLINLFRRKKMPIIYTKAIILDIPSLKRKYYEFLHPAWINEKALVKGHMRYYSDVNRKLDCSEVIEELLPLSGDIVIEKEHYNAFIDTTLEYTLRALKVEYLVIVGIVTQVCVESTAKGAFDRQFMVALVSDGVASFSADLHAAVLKSFPTMWGRVMKTEEVIQELK